MKDFYSLSEALRQYRFYYSLTQSELAELLDVSLRTLQLWESNKSFPNAKNYRKIIDIIR